MTNITFKPDTHEYFVEGKKKPSVTTILRDEGMYFNPNAGKHHAAMGTAIHKGCQVVAAGEWNPATTHPAIRPKLEAFRQFYTRHRLKALMWEVPIYHSNPEWCGTFDLIAERDGEIWLIDTKSGAPPQYAGVQTAMYELGARHCGIIKPGTKVYRYCLSLLGDGKIYPGKPSDFVVGTAAALLWHWRRQNNTLGVEIQS